MNALRSVKKNSLLVSLGVATVVTVVSLPLLVPLWVTGLIAAGSFFLTQAVLRA